MSLGGFKPAVWCTYVGEEVPNLLAGLVNGAQNDLPLAGPLGTLGGLRHDHERTARVQTGGGL